jgi:hypothetical protein
MRKALGRALLVLLALLLPALGLAQGIGDVAARERQKRDTKGPGDKPRVLTNDDLPKREPGKPASAAAAGGGAASGAESSSEDEKIRRQEEKEGGSSPADSAVAQAQANADAARDTVVAAEARLKELQDKLNPMSPSFIYGGTRTGDAVGEEMRTREEMRQAEAELEAARAALVQANQALEDARRAARLSPSE